MKVEDATENFKSVSSYSPIFFLFNHITLARLKLVRQSL